jgi:membrane fusion protein (multidrug efflux system)
VSFNPYGDSVYRVEKGESPGGKPAQVARQVFVKLGPTRGDQIAILQGVKEGDTVVTSGQLKLHNGSVVTVNNEVQPSNEPSPKPREH